MSKDVPLLLVGEVFVDFTFSCINSKSKLRLGGIVHAARGLWAINQQFSAAVVCPAYLVSDARKYLKHLGCIEFIWLAEVNGSPNVMVIGDATEVSDQGYQDLLRDGKSVEFKAQKKDFVDFMRCLVFPGKFDLSIVAKLLSNEAEISLDIAYDIPDFSLLNSFSGRLSALITSTSSDLFLTKGGSNFVEFINELETLSPVCILLKENRGGSRLFDLEGSSVDEIPALLNETTNSVGVGDVYSAVFVSLFRDGMYDAAWKAARAASCYAQTTFPDDLKRDISRSLGLSVEQMRGLGGTFLPWHDRQKFQIYLAAPDFTYVDRTFIDKALEALKYHNFNVRRPVQENGELPIDSDFNKMSTMFAADIAMLGECEFVFAIPFGRDPGTLVEIGWAMASGIPIITYDPLNENTNTMVIAGSAVYSDKLDICLNGLFETISKRRAARK